MRKYLHLHCHAFIIYIASKTVSQNHPTIRCPEEMQQTDSGAPHVEGCFQQMPEVVVVWAPIERQKIGVHIFERANLSGFAMWEFTAKEELNPQKQVILLTLRLWPVQKPNIWSIFYEKKFTSENSVV